MYDRKVSTWYAVAALWLYLNGASAEFFPHHVGNYSIPGEPPEGNIAFGIVTYGAPLTLERCVNSILNSNSKGGMDAIYSQRMSIEVIIFLMDPSEESRGTISSLKRYYRHLNVGEMSPIKVIEATGAENFNVGKAYLSILRQVRSKYVILLPDDYSIPNVHEELRDAVFWILNGVTMIEEGMADVVRLVHRFHNQAHTKPADVFFENDDVQRENALDAVYAYRAPLDVERFETLLWRCWEASPVSHRSSETEEAKLRMKMRSDGDLPESPDELWDLMKDAIGAYCARSTNAYWSPAPTLYNTRWALHHLTEFFNETAYTPPHFYSRVPQPPLRPMAPEGEVPFLADKEDEHGLVDVWKSNDHVVATNIGVFLYRPIDVNTKVLLGGYKGQLTHDAFIGEDLSHFIMRKMGTTLLHNSSAISPENDHFDPMNLVIPRVSIDDHSASSEPERCLIAAEICTSAYYLAERDEIARADPRSLVESWEERSLLPIVDETKNDGDRDLEHSNDEEMLIEDSDDYWPEYPSYTDDYDIGQNPTQPDPTYTASNDEGPAVVPGLKYNHIDKPSKQPPLKDSTKALLCVANAYSHAGRYGEALFVYDHIMGAVDKNSQADCQDASTALSLSQDTPPSRGSRGAYDFSEWWYVQMRMDYANTLWLAGKNQVAVKCLLRWLERYPEVKTNDFKTKSKANLTRRYRGLVWNESLRLRAPRRDSISARQG